MYLQSRGLPTILLIAACSCSLGAYALDGHTQEKPSTNSMENRSSVPEWHLWRYSLSYLAGAAAGRQAGFKVSAKSPRAQASAVDALVKQELDTFSRLDEAEFKAILQNKFGEGELTDTCLAQHRRAYSQGTVLGLRLYRQEWQSLLRGSSPDKAADITTSQEADALKVAMLAEAKRLGLSTVLANKVIERALATQATVTSESRSAK
jgi:hypothetical protein